MEKKVINYAPYVYACRTGMDSSTKTFHVFVLVPVAKSKSIHFFHQSKAGIERGINLAENTLGIHLQANRRSTKFGDKITANGQAFWAGYISFEYSGNENIPTADYEYTINVHKNDDGQADNAIKVVYGDVEELSQADFNELKDGDFALACPYAYLYQKEIKGKTTFFSEVLIPEIEKNVAANPFASNQETANTALVVPSRMVTSENIAIQVIENAPFETELEENFIEVSTSINNNGSLDFDYKNSNDNQGLLKSRNGGGGGKKKKKMKVRTKPASF